MIYLGGEYGRNGILTEKVARGISNFLSSSNHIEELSLRFNQLNSMHFAIMLPAFLSTNLKKLDLSKLIGVKLRL